MLVKGLCLLLLCLLETVNISDSCIVAMHIIPYRTSVSLLCNPSSEW